MCLGKMMFKVERKPDKQKEKLRNGDKRRRKGDTREREKGDILVEN